MGYRSDVRIMTSRKGFEELKKYTDKYLKDNGWEGDNLLDHLKVDIRTSLAVYFGWDDIKWYEGIDSYANVNAVWQGLNYLAENDYSYRFARLGEDYDDYEERYHDAAEDEDLEFPSLMRKFDDEYTQDQMIQDECR